MPQKHIRDIKPLLTHSLEPKGIRIIFPGKIIGAHICQVVSFFLENPQIKKSL
jgi:hypothetical protein